MGRWIVIISLAMAHCPDLATAAPPTTGIPLPKPRPVRRDHPAPMVKAVVAPRVARPMVESTNEELQSSPPPLSPVEAPGSQVSDVQTPAAVKSGKADGNCDGGKRTMSTYYWQGSHTASGEVFNPHGMTAAHRTLPFGTRLTVSNPRTGKSVIVVVNDRGPFRPGFSIDLSLGAAQAIGMHSSGAVCIQ